MSKSRKRVSKKRAVTAAAPAMPEVTPMKVTSAVRERVVALQDENGRLTPAMLVEDARDPNSPLHRLFDWDDASAAEKQRLHTARQILVSVKVVVVTEHVSFKAPLMLRDPASPPREQGYVSLVALQKDAVAARAAMLTEFHRAESALSRARNVASVLNLSDEIEALIMRLTGLREVIAGEAAAPSQPS